MNYRYGSLLLGASLATLLVISSSCALAEKPSAVVDEPLPETVTKLFEFKKGEAGSTLGWLAINDGVMGGRSSGGFTVDDGVLLFKGELSLENNGGFSSIRTEETAFDLSKFDGVVLRVRGDGRSYQMRFNTDARYRGGRVAYRGEFSTVAGKWVEIRIPFSELEPTFRGRDLDGPLFEAAKVGAIGLLIGDKKPGEFQLEVDWLAGYSVE